MEAPLVPELMGEELDAPELPDVYGYPDM